MNIYVLTNFIRKRTLGETMIPPVRHFFDKALNFETPSNLKAIGLQSRHTLQQQLDRRLRDLIQKTFRTEMVSYIFAILQFSSQPM